MRAHSSPPLHTPFKTAKALCLRRSKSPDATLDFSLWLGSQQVLALARIIFNFFHCDMNHTKEYTEIHRYTF